MKSFALSFGLLALVLAGCGDDKKTITAPVTNISGQSFYVIEGSGRQENGGFTAEKVSLTGTEKLKFEKNHFDLSFTLKDGGSLVLISNSKDRLADGVSIRIERTGDKISAASANLGKASTDLLPLLAGVDATKQIDLAIEVHQEGKTHVLFAPQGGKFEEAEFPALDAFHVNWGVQLNQATLISVKTSQSTLE